MKSVRDFRPTHQAEDSMKKAVKLEPVKKSGKERHQLYDDLDDDDQQLDYYKKKESVLDYFDDGPE